MPATYEFRNLKDIINHFILVHVGEGKIIPKATLPELFNTLPV